MVCSLTLVSLLGTACEVALSAHHCVCENLYSLALTHSWPLNPPPSHTHTHTGILDQGRGVLIVFEGTAVDQTYTTALETISSMGKVVDGLYSRAMKLQ